MKQERNSLDGKDRAADLKYQNCEVHVKRTYENTFILCRLTRPEIASRLRQYRRLGDTPEVRVSGCILRPWDESRDWTKVSTSYQLVTLSKCILRPWDESRDNQSVYELPVGNTSSKWLQNQTFNVWASRPYTPLWYDFLSMAVLPHVTHARGRFYSHTTINLATTVTMWTLLLLVW
jgi:hypothetical protein